MRNFTRFIKNKKRARLDIHCLNLEKKEEEELSKTLKNMGFTFCYALPDSISAFLIGKAPEIRNIKKELRKNYGFSWAEGKNMARNLKLLF